MMRVSGPFGRKRGGGVPAGHAEQDMGHCVGQGVAQARRGPLAEWADKEDCPQWTP